jgi:hypothetical protein
LGFVLALISLLWLASGRLPQAKKISISPFFSSPKELRCRRTPLSPHEQPTWSQAKAMSGGGGNGPLGFILALTNLLWPGAESFDLAVLLFTKRAAVPTPLSPHE